MTLVYDRLTPKVLGRIVALYEHRVFVEGVVLGMIFILLENFLALFQGNIQRLTIVHYERSFLWPSVVG